MYYSKTTGGFYDKTIHGKSIPQDAVEITPQLHAHLLDGQASGKRIVADATGRPTLQAPPSPTADAIWENIKDDRDHRSAHSGVQIGGKWYHTDAASKLHHLGNKDTARDQIAAGGTMADALRDPLTGQQIVWKTMDGSWQPLTVQLAFDIAAAVKAAELAHHAAAEQHRAAMAAAADPAAYDYSGGWPPAFVREVQP